jgi:4-amino-4-deoxy-L-arabinose transferase-like glycosyltransferase
VYLAVTAIAQPWGAVAGDEQDLLWYARSILAGHYAAPHTMDAIRFLWHGPGTPFVLAPLVAAHVPLEAMRFLMAPVLFGAVLVFHRLLRVRYSPRAALAGAFALGLYLPFLPMLTAVRKEPLAVLLVASGLLGLSRYIARGDRRYMALGGLSLAALVMVRLEFGWVVIALLLACGGWWALRRSSLAPRRATAVAALAVAGCVPWLAYTYSLTHKPLYWGNSGGSSLYWMSPTGPGETGQWHAGHTVYRNAKFARYRPFLRHLQTLPPVARNAALQNTAIANIRAHPAEYARNLAANAGRMWFLVPFWPRQAWGTLALCWIFNGLLLLGSAWAAATLFRNRLRLAPETFPIAAFAGFGLLLHLFPSADPRMLLPMVPALAWLIAQAAAVRFDFRQVVPA